VKIVNALDYAANVIGLQKTGNGKNPLQLSVGDKLHLGPELKSYVLELVTWKLLYCLNILFVIMKYKVFFFCPEVTPL
jgi:hypothetical protein